MTHAHSILRLPVITENSTSEKEKLQTLTFKVARGANKIEIRKAVEKVFKVKVASVRTANFHGKVRRHGRYSGRKPNWKKAYVTLKKGEKMFEFSEMV